MVYEISQSHRGRFKMNEFNLSEKNKFIVDKFKINKKIYNESFKCCKCGKVIGEYSSKNKQRVIKSWASICLKCLRKYEKIKREIDKLAGEELVK